jgi:hypothetical protein
MDVLRILTPKYRNNYQEIYSFPLNHVDYETKQITELCQEAFN